jgi:hypothetical protein
VPVDAINAVTASFAKLQAAMKAGAGKTPAGKPSK